MLDQILPKVYPQHQERFEIFYNQLNNLINTDESFVLPEKVIDGKDILLITATHGDENIGIEATKNLNSTNCDILIANELALQKKIKFVDCDLNKVAPGNAQSEKYEEKRAFEIIQKAQNYNYVIDLHSSSANCGQFIILTKLSFEDFLLALRLNIKNIVIWLPSEKRPTGPIVQFLESAIQIESGPRETDQIIEQLENSLRLFLENYHEPICVNDLNEKNIFVVYGKQEQKIEGAKDFELINFENEEFYPLLINEYLFFCYKMIKIV